jgi:hypothetical protein
MRAVNYRALMMLAALVRRPRPPPSSDWDIGALGSQLSVSVGNTGEIESKTGRREDKERIRRRKRA